MAKNNIRNTITARCGADRLRLQLRSVLHGGV